MPRVSLAEYRALRKKSAARKAGRAAKGAVLWAGKPGFGPQAEKGARKAYKSTSNRAGGNKTGGRKPPLLPLGQIKKAMDDTCSILVRRRDTIKYAGMCPFGCGRPIQCAFHFVRKSRSLRLRYDLRNIVGACGPCNGYMENNEGPFWLWYAKTYGLEQMETLQRESHGRTDFTRSHLETVHSDLKRRIQTGDYQ